MALPDDIREFIPGTVRYARERDEKKAYWIENGKIFWHHKENPVRGAHIESFRFYLGGFAKDHNHCYCQNSRLKGGIGATFRALNFTWYTDGNSVWALGGKVADADAQSFVACDDGVHYLGGGGRVPHGYGKDKSRVFYYNFDGKPNWVRKASPETFKSFVTVQSFEDITLARRVCR